MLCNLRSVFVFCMILLFALSTLGCAKYKKFTDQRLQNLDKATREMRQAEQPARTYSNRQESVKAIPSASLADVPTNPGCYIDRGKGLGWESIKDLRAKHPQVAVTYDCIEDVTTGWLSEAEGIASLKEGLIDVGNTVWIAQRFTPTQMLQEYSIASHSGDPLMGLEFRSYTIEPNQLSKGSINVILEFSREYISGDDKSVYAQGYTLFKYDLRNTESKIFMIQPTFEKGIVISLDE